MRRWLIGSAFLAIDIAISESRVRSPYNVKFISIFYRVRKVLTREALVMLYNSLAYPHLTYCNFVWRSGPKTTIGKLLLLRKNCESYHFSNSKDHIHWKTRGNNNELQMKLSSACILHIIISSQWNRAQLTRFHRCKSWI